MTKYSQWLEFAKEISLKSGDVVFDLYHSKKTLQFKEGLDGRPSTVTEADEKSESFLKTSIQEQFPTHGIYGEEGTKVNLDSDYIWYLDPIDGTTNFWRHIPLFGLSVGLTYKKKPVLGVLHFPALQLTLTAHEEGKTVANNTEVTVSSRQLKRSLYYISCQEARDGLRFPSIEKQVGWIKAIDVSSFEFAQIAMGDAEVYTFFKSSPQDMVAGTIIVQQAGGKVTDENNLPWTTDSEIIVASNGVDHDALIRLVKKDMKK